jgi:thiopeptide-type bacteriocin biosynthesis protein
MKEDNKTKDSNQEAQPQVQRDFIIGDEWLYFKFYCGPKTADIVLTRLVKTLAHQLLTTGDIDKWFFIRYGDPKQHIRVRFHVKTPQALLKTVMAVNNMAKPFIQQDLIWKIQVDTYQREIERYGTRSMDMSETIFFYDSRMIVDMLDMIEGDDGDRIRWLFGLRAVDNLLEDFGYSMEEKYEQVTRLRENFGMEFGMNRSLKQQLEKKFRQDRGEITDLLNHTNDEENQMFPLFELIDRKSRDSKPIAEKILTMYDNKTPNPFLLHDLMASFSHMLVNRLFKSKQRMQEMVLYDFLHRYYKSEIGRRKYEKINREKKKKEKKS